MSNEGSLSELSIDSLLNTLEFYLRSVKDLKTIRLAGRFFNDLVSKNPWVARGIMYYLVYFPKKPKKFVWRINSYYKRQFGHRTRRNDLNFLNMRPWEKLTFISEKNEPLFPNLEYLEIYSHYTKSVAQLKHSNLKHFKNTFGDICSRRTKEEFSFPQTLESLHINNTHGCNLEKMSTLNLKTLKDVTLFNMGSWYGTTSLKYLLDPSLNNSNEVLESLTLVNCEIDISSLENDIPKLVNLKSIYLNFGVSFRFQCVTVDIVKNFTGSKWGKALRKLEKLKLVGGTGDTKSESEPYRCHSGGDLFPTPFDFESWVGDDECFGCATLKVLDVWDVPALKDVHLMKMENLEVLKINGESGVVGNDFKKLKKLKEVVDNRKKDEK